MKNEVLVIEELDLKPKIINEAKIEFDEKGINLIIEAYESKYSNIIIRLEDEKLFTDDLKNINEAIKKISRYRIDTEKEIKRPLDLFVEKYKDVEKRLKALSENISKQLNEFKENLFNERIEKMKEIKANIVKELNIENLEKVIPLPELKGMLSTSSYTEAKAERLVREKAEEVLKQYKNLKTLVELESVKSNVKLNVDDYILVMDNEEEVKARINFQVKAIRENEERIKKEQEDKIRKELEQKAKEAEVKEVVKTERKIENNKTKILEIELNNLDVKKQKLLKQFLIENDIEYQVNVL